MKFKELEILKITAPLGLQFRDIITLEPVISGLSVKASSIELPLESLNANSNGNGVYYFSHLPGLRDFEYSDEKLDLENIPFESPPLKFIIQVDDHEDRFQSVTFLVSAPQKGIYPNIESVGSPYILSSYDLFPSSLRRTPAGFAEVRADVTDKHTGKPAAYTLIEVESGSNSYFGLSDEKGKVVVMFPYPPVEVVLTGSPLVGTRISLSQQTWELKIKVHYSPSLVEYFSELKKPNLKTILNQFEAEIFISDTEPKANTLSATLSYGRPLILKSEGKSDLFIRAISSP